MSNTSSKVTRAGGVSILILVIVGTIIVSFWFGADQRGLGELGLTGVFVVNFLGNATIFVPVPGLTAIGQTLIITTATTTNPILVGLIAGTAMTLAEITSYVVGRAGRRMSGERDIPLRGWLRELFRRGSKVVSRVMLRYGVLTLFVLSIIPNPFFEIAGITAGAVRMNFWRFLVPVGLGKTGRAFILAYLGDVFL